MISTAVKVVIEAYLEAYLPSSKIPTLKLKMHLDISVVATSIEYRGS